MHDRQAAIFVPIPWITKMFDNWKCLQPEEKHTSQHVCSSRLRDRAAVENRCGYPDHSVESLFRMKPPTQTCRWRSTFINPHWDLSTLSELYGMGPVDALSCKNVCKARSELKGGCLRLNSAGCSSLVCCWAEGSGKWCSVSGLRQSFLRRGHWGQLSEPRINIADTWQMCTFCGCGQVHVNTVIVKISFSLIPNGELLCQVCEYVRFIV